MNATRGGGSERKRQRARALRRLVLATLLGFLPWVGAVWFPRIASAQHRDGGLAQSADVDAGADDADDAGGGSVDPGVTALRRLTDDVKALVEDRLAVDVVPQTLFDVELGDESAIRLEGARLGALLREVDAARARRDAGTKPTRRGDSGDAGDAEAGSVEVAPRLWEARVELDRARLGFYTLATARQRELLANHTKRALEKKPSEADQAEARREQALKAARDARSEAERLVSEEYARLLEVEAAQTTFEKNLNEQSASIAARREATLGWKRRAREARAAKDPTNADRTYDELRKALRAARDDLDRALDEVSSDTSKVPQAGADPLAALQASVDSKTAREERALVETSARRLSAEEKSLRDERASQRLDEVDALNGERLAMLPFLSSDKRSSVTGFTTEGADQAASEVRQLTLIARFHRYAATTWLASLRHPRPGLGLSAGAVVFVVLEWLAAVGAFFWLRRRIPTALQGLRKRAQDNDRHERLTAPSVMTRVFAFALEVHRPVEWLALALLLSWLLPGSAQGLLEVQLVTVIVQWVLGGALVVVVVNALAGAERGSNADGVTAALRLRSLRLVGRVIVAFGLVLVLTSRLVGPGTIYQWVFSTCWLASIPVVLVLVRWWRNVVFERAERSRKKDAFEQWVLANRVGWKSFLAAMGGGIYLFARGTWRAVRSWVSRFTVTRSLLAYLFRRELGKLEAERADLETAQIGDAAFEVLGPTAHGARVATALDEHVERLRARLRDRRGGVVALVAPLGMGKSVLLRELHEAFPDTVLLTAPEGGEQALQLALGEALGLPPTTSFDASAEALAASPSGRALFLDDAHRFVQPLMGGLATFDKLLASASRHSATTTWVFAVDEVVWLFLKRARGARPLFDDVIRIHPWRDEQIVELLTTRTRAAGLEPSFERLLEKLPPNADEIDKQEALERRAASYYRLLWDYSAGNPGIALHMWRRSLGTDAEGGTHVRFFQAPEAQELDVLPDQTVFVLRAVLQLAPASPADIAKATMLSAADILDALRYAEARTYVAETNGRYRITWTWLRAFSLFLQRRHLMVAP